mmetsp:Transcript_13499/g.49111  ORF Transcript_13499/g.49111 Transcript_13499/m.49111 type:complete len:242 (+) Transcript_13499:340-1065(+)
MEAEAAPSQGGALLPTDMTILLVDDDRTSRLIVSGLLIKCGYKVEVADSGQQALDILRAEQKQIHLVLTDVMMPGIDGLDLLKAVRTSQRYHHVPVIMMSSNEHVGTVWESVRLGAEDYLLKPVGMRDVQHIWTHVWRRRILFQRQGVKQVEEAQPPLVDEDSDDHDSVAEGASVVMTAEEMRAYCQRQIARYTRVIEMIDKYPQCFPQPGKSEEDEVAELLSQTYLDAAQINQGLKPASG